MNKTRPKALVCAACVAIASACAHMDCMRDGLRCERWDEQGGKCGLVASATQWESGAIAFNEHCAWAVKFA